MKSTIRITHACALPCLFNRGAGHGGLQLMYLRISI